MVHREPLITCQVSRTTLGTSKNVKFLLSRNSTKFDVVVRFCETISIVKSVLSSVILKNSGFSTEITFYPFLENLNFLGFYNKDWRFCKIMFDSCEGFITFLISPSSVGPLEGRK